MTTPLVRRGRAVPPGTPEQLVTGTPSTISALPVAVALNLYAGDDFTMIITVKNPDGSLVDLTGYTVTGQVKHTPADASALGTFTCTPGGTAGTITCTLANSLTATLAAPLVYDVQMKSAGGIITTLVAGAITFAAQVTTP
jgi:hypothetical protein